MSALLVSISVREGPSVVFVVIDGVVLGWGGSGEFCLLSVQGQTITIQPPSDLAAIDTGTTLIGAPTPIATSIWAHWQVPDSTELTRDWQGLYAFRRYLGTNCTISSLNMNLSTLNDSMIGNANTTSQMKAAGLRTFYHTIILYMIYDLTRHFAIAQSDFCCTQGPF
ncbi:hypothetical protein EDB19DRAFT_2028724 [Suillus lakei]|nr:hypothetical protein EDB19DRAFT_2028724 [Suillus lakei]